MQFVQIGMLGALGALAIPLLIHLMFRARARPLDLGTLQFLKVVLRENQRRRRLKRWLLLAVRLACVALVAVVFARPYMLATEPVAGDRLVVILIDRSASMGHKDGARPIDQALAEAKVILGQPGTDTQLEVAAFDRAVHPVTRPTDLLATGFEPTAAGTDFGSAMAWARDLFVRSKKVVKVLHIFTDLQRSGLLRSDTVSLPSDIEVHLHDVGRAFPKNVGVTDIAISPQTLRPGDTASITAAVLNAALLPVAKRPIRLHVEAGGQKRDVEQTIDLEGGATARVTFMLEGLPQGLWRGHVEAASGDELPFDDRRYLGFWVAPPARVLLVDGDPGRAPFESETYFLRAALRLAPEGQHYAKSPFDPQVIDLAAGTGLPSLEQTAAVVLANVASTSASDAQRLAEFVERGGGLLVFTGQRVEPESTNTLDAVGLGIGEVIGPASATDLPWRIERWEEQHPVWKPFADPEHGDLRRPAFTAITRVKPAPEAHVLAWFRGGEPALLERTKGAGRVLWFTAACDRDAGDWPRGRMYVPMLHQMVAQAAGLADGGPVRLLLAGEGQAPGVTDRDGRLLVVNSDPLESQTARCTPQEFADRFGFPLRDPAGPAAARQSRDGPADDRSRSDELWPFLALVLFGLLLVESFLGNRTAA